MLVGYLDTSLNNALLSGGGVEEWLEAQTCNLEAPGLSLSSDWELDLFQGITKTDNR